MADSRGQQDIFGLDIDKMVKGISKFKYTFLEEFNKTKMKGDSKRWFKKDPTRIADATAPSASKNVSPGSRPMTQEISWTRDTVYTKKYFIEGFLDKEDITDAEIDTYGQTLKDLTERIIRDRDVDLYNLMTENQTPVQIGTFATTAVGGDQWDAPNFAADPIKDLNRAIRIIQNAGFSAKGASCIMDGRAYESLINWLISGKGSSIPGFSSEKIKTGVVMNLLGLNIKVSTEAVTDNVLVTVGSEAQTYAESEAMTANTSIDPGVGRNIRVWTRGIGYITNASGSVLITDINT